MCRGDRQRRQRSCHRVTITGVREHAAFDYSLGQFFDEQRHAVGAVDDLVGDLSGQRLPTGHAHDHLGALPGRQAIETEQRHLRAADPGRNSGLFTEQRKVDILKMLRPLAAATEMPLVAQKTSDRVPVQIHSEYRSIIDAAPVDKDNPNVSLHLRADGVPWSYEGFKTAWGRELDKPEMTLFRQRRWVFHGLLEECSKHAARGRMLRRAGRRNRRDVCGHGAPLLKGSEQIPLGAQRDENARKWLGITARSRLGEQEKTRLIGWQTPFPAARYVALGLGGCQPPSLKINEKRTSHFSFNHGVEGSSPSALTMSIFASCFLNVISRFCQTGAQV